MANRRNKRLGQRTCAASMVSSPITISIFCLLHDSLKSLLALEFLPKLRLVHCNFHLKKIYFNWRIIALQCFVGFCHTMH